METFEKLENLDETNRYRRRNFGMALPISALFFVVIGPLFLVLIYIEEGWSLHIIGAIPFCALFTVSAAGIYKIYRDGNEVIEISSDGISHITRKNGTKTLKYSEIEILEYYIPYSMPPTIALKGLKCKIAFDMKMEDYPSAINQLFNHFIKNGRYDLIKSYNQQVRIVHKIAI